MAAVEAPLTEPKPVEVWSHDTWWPGQLEEWQQVGGAWWGLVAYEIAPVLADARGREHVIRESRRMWQHERTFRPRA